MSRTVAKEGNSDVWHVTIERERKRGGRGEREVKGNGEIWQPHEP